MADHPVKRLWRDSPLCSESLLKAQIDIFDKLTDAVEKSVSNSRAGKSKRDMRVKDFPKSEEK